MEKRYQHHVSFAYSKKGGGLGIGSNVITAPNKMRTQREIEEVANFIKENHADNIENVVILFWKRLQKEEEQ